MLKPTIIRTKTQEKLKLQLLGTASHMLAGSANFKLGLQVRKSKETSEEMQKLFKSGVELGG